MDGSRRFLVAAAMCLAVLSMAAPWALAQNGDDGAGGASSGRAATAQDSFASVFFISYETSPTGERSVEIVGSLIIWFLLALSVLNIGLIGRMAMLNQRKTIVPDDVVAEVKRKMEGGKYKEAMEGAARESSFFSAVLRAGLSEANHGLSAMVRKVEETSDELTVNMLRQLEYLNVLGQVSPMIGLFGTVYGMILAFRAIVASGGNADPVLLAAGIGTALVTTFWGLLIAIPALSAYAIIRNKIDALTTEATLEVETLINQFRSKASAESGKARPKDS